MSKSSTSQFNLEGAARPEINDGAFEWESSPIIFRFHGDYTDEQKRWFTSAQRNDLTKLCSYLRTDASLVQGMQYEVFDTREGKQQADPNHSISRASARFQEYALYRFWLPNENPSFPHELTHLVAHRWADPYQFTTELDTANGQVITKTLDMVSTSFMQEGLAVAVDDILFQRNLTENGVTKPIDDFCRDQIGMMPKSLTSVMNIDGFGSFPNEIVVPFAASFSKFLITEYDLSTYKKVYVALKETRGPEENVAILEQVLGEEETMLLHKWLTALTTTNI